MGPITISLPIYLKMGKKKPETVSLNLNQYRNWDFHKNNNIKILFKDTITPRIAYLPRMTKVKLIYRLFFGSRRAIDISNICCVVDKFFSDALTETGKLPDDCMDHISKVDYRWGGIDTQNPRVEVTLEEIELHQEEDKPMQLFLTQDEIATAIKDYYLKQLLTGGQTAIVQIGTYSGQNQVTATITIGEAPQLPVSKDLLPPLLDTAMTAAEAESYVKPVARTRKKDVPTPAPEPVQDDQEEAPAAVSAPEVPVPQPASEARPEPVPEPAAVVAEPVAAQAAAEEEPPFEPDVKPEPVVATPAPAPAPAQASKGIFGSQVSSAPQPAIPAAAPGPKSLFANLVKPKNDTPAASH